MRSACLPCAVLVVSACGPAKPAGALGAGWGETPDVAAARMHLRVDACRPRGAFTICGTTPTARAFERPAWIDLVRSDRDELVGIEVRFPDCDAGAYVALQKAIASRFNVEYVPGRDASPYTKWSSGAVVHFVRSASWCTLTVADDAYGDAFSDALLANGFRDLGGALSPR